MKKTTIILFTTLLLISCNSKTPQETQKSVLNLNNSGSIEQSQNTESNSSGSVETNSSSGETQELVQKVEGLDIDLVKFNEIYKQALYNSGQAKDEAKSQINNCVELWGNIISKYRGYEVVGFEKSTDLDKTLIEIGINLLTASDFSTGGKMEIAHSELEKVRMTIMKIRQENNIKSISDDMLIVHNKMEEIVENGATKDDNKIQELKTDIQKLKEYNTDKDEYKKMLSDFENAVNSLKDLSGNDYNTKLKELKPLFIKMYMKFG
ncbi:MAG: hypothetical protein PHS49_03520 [Candidatus Gracilibacteria bacterium]|nr:hypothetical protein [Candidatus Gracilibacteria bacterium]